MHAYSTAFLSIMNTPTINSNAYRTQGLSIVVFGASGHLARVKIMPSLFRLFGHDKLPPFTFIYGYARTKMTSEEWRESLKRDLMSISGANSDLVTEFLSKCVYVSGDSYRDVAAYSRLEKLIREQEDQHSLMYQQANRMFYLAVPPNVFIDTAMVRNACRMRVVAPCFQIPYRLLIAHRISIIVDSLALYANSSMWLDTNCC